MKRQAQAHRVSVAIKAETNETSHSKVVRLPESRRVRQRTGIIIDQLG